MLWACERLGMLHWGTPRASGWLAGSRHAGYLWLRKVKSNDKLSLRVFHPVTQQPITDAAAAAAVVILAFRETARLNGSPARSEEPPCLSTDIPLRAGGFTQTLGVIKPNKG